MQSPTTDCYPDISTIQENRDLKMNTLKSKFTLAVVLLSGPCQVWAHTGNHGMSSWYHYLASPDHALLLVALALTGLGISVCSVRNATSKSQ